MHVGKRYICWGRIIRKFISKSPIIQSQCFYGELCVYGEPWQLIPYTSVEPELRYLWPDGMDSRHSTRCGGFRSQTKDTVEVKGGTWVNDAKRRQLHVWFSLELWFGNLLLLSNSSQAPPNHLWEMTHTWRDCSKSGLKLRQESFSGHIVTLSGTRPTK